MLKTTRKNHGHKSEETPLEGWSRGKGNETDPGGHQWPPTYPPGSKQLFSSLEVFS